MFTSYVNDLDGRITIGLCHWQNQTLADAFYASRKQYCIILMD